MDQAMLNACSVSEGGHKTHAVLAYCHTTLNAQRRARRVGSSDRKLPAAAHGARRDARLERALSRLRAAR